MSSELDKNVKGRYYVDRDVCLCHEFCLVEAPDNIRMDEESWQAYFFKQPTTPEEEAQCKNAMSVCPVEAICNDGDSSSD
jgi:ferredoxin